MSLLDGCTNTMLTTTFGLWVFVFIASVYVLVRAAKYFTTASEQIGKALHLPNFIVGTVIVAIGTSAPEAFTSLFGTVAGESEFLAGTVIGTVMANTLLGLGLAVLLTRRVVRFDWDLIANDLPLFLGAAVFLILMLLDGEFTTTEGIIMLLGYGVYLFYVYTMRHGEEVEMKLHKRKKKHQPLKIRMIFTFCVSLLVLFVASKFTVDAVIEIAHIIGIGTSLVAASALAVSTSLPEIVVAVTAARRGNFDLALGDIVGSNIFDLFVIFGIGGMVTTLTVDDVAFRIGLPMLIGIILLLWLVLIDKKFTKAEAMLFVLAYLLFLGKLFGFI